MIIPKFEYFNSPGKLKKTHVLKAFPGFYKYLIQKYHSYNYSKFSELIYCYYNNIETHPICPNCGKEVPFLDKNRGYQKYCSTKCSNSDQSVKDKKIKTNINKYGTPYASQNDSIKQKTIEIMNEKYGGCGNASKDIKAKQMKTMIDRYGVCATTQNEYLKQKVIQTHIDRYNGIGMGSNITSSKIINTNLEKYGTQSPLSNDIVRDKIGETNIERYGYKVSTKNEEVSKKISETKCKNYLNSHKQIIDIYKENDITFYKIQCPHPNCSLCENKHYIIPAHIYFDRIKDKTELCTIRLPIQQYRGKDTTIELFVRDILDEHNIEYATNVKSIISPLELDIYIPSKNIAIECNGCYWHSSFEKPNNYHINKYKKCREKSIQLISIWEDWIQNKPRIVKSIILSKLGLIKDSIYARKCIIKEIDSKVCNSFLDQNHIQGGQKSSVKIGLYYNNELVSVMTFCKNCSGIGDKKIKNDTWELSRFCNKLNINVVGAASKLLKYFIKTRNPKTIISFSMNDISNGSLYKTLGFACDNNIAKAYWYINNNVRYHRTCYTKDALIKKGLAPNHDKSTWTEFEVMEKNGFLRIHDSGQLKWVLGLTSINY